MLVYPGRRKKKNVVTHQLDEAGERLMKAYSDKHQCPDPYDIVVTTRFVPSRVMYRWIAHNERHVELIKQYRSTLMTLAPRPTTVEEMRALIEPHLVLTPEQVRKLCLRATHGVLPWRNDDYGRV
jgi:hypothetical protein